MCSKLHSDTVEYDPRCRDIIISNMFSIITTTITIIIPTITITTIIIRISMTIMFIIRISMTIIIASPSVAAPALPRQPPRRHGRARLRGVPRQACNVCIYIYICTHIKQRVYIYIYIYILM